MTSFTDLENRWNQSSRATAQQQRLPPPPPPPRPAVIRVPDHHQIVSSSQRSSSEETEFDQPMARSSGGHTYDTPGLGNLTMTPRVGQSAPRQLVDRPESGSSEPFLGRGTRANNEDVHSDPQKLEASVRVMGRVFKVLVVVSVCVVIVYIATIILLVVTLLKENSADSSTPGEPAVAGERGSRASAGESLPDNCVPESDLKDFLSIWDPQGLERVFDELKKARLDFRYTDSKTICFGSLKWVPHVMSKINAAVEESVTYIEDQQEKINSTVSQYSSVNISTLCKPKDTATVDVTDPASRKQPVFAHFFLNTTANYTAGETRSLKWTMEGRKLSSKHGVDVAIGSGTFTVRHSGYYFLYSHVVFLDDVTSNRLHQVVKKSGSQETVLLTSVQGPVSYLQGVFKLKAQETLTVNVTCTLVDMQQQRSTYFGMYLVRT